jgi:hypothetical protein
MDAGVVELKRMEFELSTTSRNCAENGVSFWVSENSNSYNDLTDRPTDLRIEHPY